MWTCGCEHGTCSLHGQKHHLKQGDHIPPEMQMVPALGCSQPVHGREHLPLQSPAWAPACEGSVAGGFQSAGEENPTHTLKTWLRAISGSELLL